MNATLAAAHDSPLGPPTLSALLAHLAPDVRHLARTLCHGVPGADRYEATHLGLVAIWQAVPRIDPARAATARAFLLAHAGYAIRKYVRVERMHLATLAESTLDMDSGAHDPDAEAATVRTVLEALAGVDPLAHAVVERHLLEGVPIVHVGPPLGLTHSQARTRYERGIAWMKRRVG